MGKQDECGHEFVIRQVRTSTKPGDIPKLVWWECENCSQRFRMEGDPGPPASAADVYDPANTPPHYRALRGEVTGRSRLVESIMGTSLVPTGWCCPKCDSIYAPHVEECHRCNKSA